MTGIGDGFTCDAFTLEAFTADCEPVRTASADLCVTPDVEEDLCR